ncbi:hypothetical protein FHK92_12490 [Pseudomonas brassicacearum subsp. neoaurantiaca]|uniref:Uncharacterized protein n=1 Tax=Pseudomonas brassicacearum subsp. neoaurantiaca TaxID=494916 RepID=A0A7V8RLD0_9PSED|nr:hypothetical protein [Pseudomonas brassicacearum subsp. neoaurantiaca]
MRRIVCRRFGASICRRAVATGCKNDRGIAESVNPRQWAATGPLRPSVIYPALAPESAAPLAFTGFERQPDEIDSSRPGIDQHRRPPDRRHRAQPLRRS